ncbi:hypothetical protein BH09PSE5_BH09PSE5_22930 [soil metagenome]
MQDDKNAAGPGASKIAAEVDDAELTPRDEAAIAATTPLVSGAEQSDPSPGGARAGRRTYPSRGHKMEIIDDTIAALSKGSVEGPLVQLVKDWIDKLAAYAHVAVDKTASTVVPLAQKAQSAAADAKASTVAKAKDYKETAAVAKDQWVGDAKAAIQERPLTAVGLALLAGMAISLIFDSRSDSES